MLQFSIMTDYDDLLKRIEALERSNRRLRLLALFAVSVALLSKLIAIWAITRTRQPIEKPAERIAQFQAYRNCLSDIYKPRWRD